MKQAARAKRYVSDRERGYKRNYSKYRVKGKLRGKAGDLGKVGPYGRALHVLVNQENKYGDVKARGNALTAVSPWANLSKLGLEENAYLQSVADAILDLKEQLWHYGQSVNNNRYLNGSNPIDDLQALLHKKEYTLRKKGNPKYAYDLVPAVVAQYAVNSLAYLIRARKPWEEVKESNAFRDIMYPSVAFKLTPDLERGVYILALAKIRKAQLFEIPISNLSTALLTAEFHRFYLVRAGLTADFYGYFLYKPQQHCYSKRPPKKIVGIDLDRIGYVTNANHSHDKEGEERSRSIQHLPVARLFHNQFVFEEAIRLTHAYRLIFMENTRNLRLGLWSRFESALKANSNAVPKCKVVSVSQAYTSQTCPMCGAKKMDKDPYQNPDWPHRPTFSNGKVVDSITHRCRYCIHRGHKDGMAAINILRKGLALEEEESNLPEWFLKKRCKRKVVGFEEHVAQREDAYWAKLRYVHLDDYIARIKEGELVPDPYEWRDLVKGTVENRPSPYKYVTGMSVDTNGRCWSSSHFINFNNFIGKSEEDIKPSTLEYVENLLVEDVVRKHSLMFVKLPILDPYNYGWERFFNKLGDRAIEYDSKLYYVTCSGTTTACLCCGSVVKFDPKNFLFGVQCEMCGYYMKRYSEAQWVLREGLDQLSKKTGIPRKDYKRLKHHKIYQNARGLGSSYPFWWNMWEGSLYNF